MASRSSSSEDDKPSSSVPLEDNEINRRSSSPMDENPSCVNHQRFEYCNAIKHGKISPSSDCSVVRDGTSHSSSHSKDVTRSSLRDDRQSSSEDIRQSSSRDFTQSYLRDDRQLSSKDFTQPSSKDVTQSSSKDLTQSSSYDLLPENSNSKYSFSDPNDRKNKTRLYPSLPDQSSSSKPSTNERLEAEMAVDNDDTNRETRWVGTDESKLKQLHIFSDKDFYNMAISKNNHTDLSEAPKTGYHPTSVDQNHVCMPFYGKKSPDNRWGTIKSSLYDLKDGRVGDARDLMNCILRYNGSYRHKWDFNGLSLFWNEMACDGPIDLLSLLPKMASLALDVEFIVSTQIPFLKRGENRSIALSKRQIACLLAHAFFCTYPMRNADPSKDKHFWSSDSLALPTINFSSMFKFDNPLVTQSKLLCIFNYFKRVTENGFDLDKKVIFKRQAIKVKPGYVKWISSRRRFTELHVAMYGQIEKKIGFLQVDFANKHVGGGVLGRGCVQEEIWFLASPELIISRLFTEVLDPDEVLIITGSEIYNQYKGYSRNFQWTGDFVDKTRNVRGVKVCQMVAMDAKKYYQDEDQFNMVAVDRELNKAFCGFFCEFKAEDGRLPAVATGNWGCGAFGGDKHLKSLIQMMAAAEAGRDVCYFAFGDVELLEKMRSIHELITSHNLTVGDVYEMIINYVDRVKYGRSLPSVRLYDYLLSTFCYAQ